MRFILGLLIGYSIRGKQRALIATLATIALIVFILIPAIALSLLAVSVHRERLSRPPQTTVPTVIGLTHADAEINLRAVHLNLRVLARRYDAPLDSGIIDLPNSTTRRTRRLPNDCRRYHCAPCFQIQNNQARKE